MSELADMWQETSWEQRQDGGPEVQPGEESWGGEGRSRENKRQKDGRKGWVTEFQVKASHRELL